MTLNREVFLRDPLSIPKIPNDGVTTVGVTMITPSTSVPRSRLSDRRSQP